MYYFRYPFEVRSLVSRDFVYKKTSPGFVHKYEATAAAVKFRIETGITDIELIRKKGGRVQNLGKIGDIT